MNCPIDKTEMEKGSLLKPLPYPGGIVWGTKFVGFIIKRVQDQYTIIAYRCPKCGKVELTTEVK